MFIRNAEAAEVPAAAETVVETQEVNPLQALARAGRLNDGDGGEIPEYIPPAPTQVEGEDVPPAVAATDTPAQAEVEQKVEVQPTPVAEAAQPIAAQPQSEVDWKEVLKKQQPKDVLNELGIDEKMANFLDFWKSGGDVAQYLKELSTDYEKMPAEDLMKHQLKRDYPTASERQIELLYKREVVEKYKLDPDNYSEEEVEEGKLLLDAYASKYRGDFIKSQQEKLLPPAPEKAEEVEPINEGVQLLQNAKGRLVASDHYRNVLSNNSITIGEGEEAFKFPVNGTELTDVIYDGEKFASSLFSLQEINGKNELIPDVEKQLLVAAVAKHGKSFIVELAKHFKAIGSQKAIVPIENPSAAGGQASGRQQEEVPDSPIGMLAKFGKLV